MKVSPILLGAVALLVVPRPHLATSQDSQEPQNSQDPQDFEDSGETNEGADEELPVAEALRIGPYWRLPRPPPRAVLVAARRSDSPFRHDFPPRNEGPFRQDLPFPDVPLTDHLYTSSLDNIQHKKLSSHNPGASEVYPPVYRTIAGVSNAYKTRRTTQTPDQVRTIETMTAEESWTILGVPFSGLPRRRRPGHGPPPHHRVQGRIRGRKAPPKVRAPPRVRQNLRRPQPAILAPVHRPLSLPSPQQPPTTPPPPDHVPTPPTTAPDHVPTPPTTAPDHAPATHHLHS
ncbi:pollen-specific leucine-rich repeat extensin-like protein 1 [Homarus americanus]|uniref:pollen-specific leucine-rich repeat extensin-like protein 1 n=1 Tax=Homarus americanus TaxID=6706 RepID=UPI001C43AA81|nr:pollen-specific leucine-rich repeat extensin-like protein 1 [Homarus americanus]